MAKYTQEELEIILKGMVEEVVGTVSNEHAKKIEDAVTLKFAELAKGLDKKDTGSDTTDNSPKFKSLGEQLASVVQASRPGGPVDVRLKAPDGMNESVPSEGAFLVQPEFSSEMIQNAHQTGLLYGKCKKLPLGNSNSLTLNGVDETSRVNGSRWGGIQIYWSDEAGTVTATKPKWRQMNLKLKKLMGVCYITDELLQDTTALQSWIMQAFSEEFGFKMDDGIYRGTGAGQLLGILNSPCLVTQAAEGGQAADTVIYENLLNMWNRMPDINRRRAEWYANQDAEVQLDQMYLATGVSGVPVFMPAGGITGTSPATIKGRPINYIEQCSALGDVGDIMLADLQSYLIIDKNAMSSDSSIHVKFLYDEMTFRFIYRVDGQPLWHNTLTAYKGGTTRSPFVTLASR
jgi:HK97 family phage major capsid protein